MNNSAIDYTVVAKRIIELAKSKGIKIGALCKKVNKSHTYLSAVAKGEVSEIPEEYLNEFVKTLGTTKTYLLGLHDDPDPEFIKHTAEMLQENISPIVELLAAMSNEEQETLHKLVALPDDERKRAMSVLSALLD